ncbi:MAG: extracellular solute-binding protein [Asticcacaulis sp.]
MSETEYTGLTWDHPRGFNALKAASETTQGFRLTWDKHPLEGFETHPIADLCARYDLVVLDHPHVGEAVAHDCLVPLEDLFSAEEIARLEADCVGPSLSSYNYAGKHWALPLDAATQVMAAREDLTGALPETWDEVVALSKRVPVALSLAGPHAALSFQSICVALGEKPAADRDRFIGQETGEAAYELMRELVARSPLSVRDKNPIGILQHMCDHHDVALCPLIYGYVNYADRLGFGNAPKGAGGIGSTLGGTGIGISRKCDVTPELLDHLRWLMSEVAQTGFIPAHDGQPSLRSAWRDKAVNARWGRFYERTLDTLEAAYLRPRHNHAIAFQTAASARLRAALDAGEASQAVITDLNTLYADYHPTGVET